MARSTGPGDPFLFVTHNGNDNWRSCPLRHDYPGALLVVDMASRPDDGERLRSNRIRRDTSTVDTPPPPSDTTVAVVRFDGKGVWLPTTTAAVCSGTSGDAPLRYVRAFGDYAGARIMR